VAGWLGCANKRCILLIGLSFICILNMEKTLEAK
jgi:hypothetical protein